MKQVFWQALINLCGRGPEIIGILKQSAATITLQLYISSKLFIIALEVTSYFKLVSIFIELDENHRLLRIN